MDNFKFDLINSMMKDENFKNLLEMYSNCSSGLFWEIFFADIDKFETSQQQKISALFKSKYSPLKEKYKKLEDSDLENDLKALNRLKIKCLESIHGGYWNRYKIQRLKKSLKKSRDNDYL